MKKKKKEEIFFFIFKFKLKTGNSGGVTNAENIKADRPKILRPTHFSCMKDI